MADTNQAIPLAGRSVDVVLNIFAPRNGAEFARVLKPGGRVVVVVPTANHLAELRRQGWLIGIQPDKRQAVQRSLAPGLRLVAAETLTVPLKLRGAQLTSLVAMTPSARHSTPQQLAQLADNGPVAVTAEFELLTFALSEALAV